MIRIDCNSGNNAQKLQTRPLVLAMDIRRVESYQKYTIDSSSIHQEIDDP